MLRRRGMSIDTQAMGYITLQLQCVLQLHTLEPYLEYARSVLMHSAAEGILAAHYGYVRRICGC